MKTLLLALVLLIALVPTPAQEIAGKSTITGKVIADRTTSGTSTLNTGLVGFWKLGEASGSAIDSSSGGNNLAANNAPGQSTGIGGTGNSRTFNGTNQFFSHASTANLVFGNSDWTMATWVYITNNTNTYLIVGKDQSSTGDREFNLYYNGGTGYFVCEVFLPVDNSVQVNATTFGIPANNTWHMLVTTFDSTTHIVSISVDGGAVQTNGAGGALQASGVSPFELAARAYSGSEVFLSGRMQYAAKWSKVLNSSEISELYNAGAGKNCCPF